MKFKVKTGYQSLNLKPKRKEKTRRRRRRRRRRHHQLFLVLVAGLGQDCARSFIRTVESRFLETPREKLVYVT